MISIGSGCMQEPVTYNHFPRESRDLSPLASSREPKNAIIYSSSSLPPNLRNALQMSTFASVACH